MICQEDKFKQKRRKSQDTSNSIKNFNPIASSVKVNTSTNSQDCKVFAQELLQNNPTTEQSDVYYMTVAKTDPLLTEK